MFLVTIAFLLGSLFVASFPTFPDGMRVRVDKSPHTWQGDFNNDSIRDTLRLVAVDRPLSSRIRVLPLGTSRNPFRVPAEIALYLQHGGNRGEFLFHNRDYLTTPLWQANYIPIRIVRRGTPAYTNWQKEIPQLRSDAVLLPTEAGIDILLYWDGTNYRVFYPNETP